MQTDLHNGIMKHDCDIDAVLKNAGLRCTKDRHDLVDLFLENRAWNASQIAKTYPKKDLSTIYRNLQKFLESDIIKPIHPNAAEEFYELANRPHHEHESCPTCRLMACIPCPVRHVPQNHILEIQTLCKACL